MCGIFVQVEIKGAVPRSMLPTPRMMKGIIHENTSAIMHKDVQEYRNGNIKNTNSTMGESHVSCGKKQQKHLIYL